MPDIDQNLTIDVTGNTAAIATDFTTIGITNAHVQVTKLSFGDSSTATRVTTTSPLPVDIRASNATVGISGSVSGNGNFRIINGISGGSTVPLIVTGTTASGTIPVQISGRVQGITSGTPVSVTGSVSINSGASIQGIVSGYPVTVTGGGRVLSSTTDSVTVTGYVGITASRYLLQATDGVRIFGGGNGETLIPVALRDGSGNIIGSSGGALNVNLVGTGVTATVTINPVVGVCQANESIPFYVAGASAGPAVRVQGSYTNNAVLVGWTGSPTVSISNIVGVSAANITTGIAGTTAINTINTNTASIPSIYTSLVGATGVNAQIVGFTRPGTVYTGNVTVGVTSGITLAAQALKTGITLKVVNNNMLVTGSGSTGGYLMSSGDVLFVETNNLGNLTFQTTAGNATLYYLAT